MPEILMAPTSVRDMGNLIRTTGQDMPDPTGRMISDAGAAAVDDAVEEAFASVGDVLLGLGAGMVRLGQVAVDAAEHMVEADARAEVGVR